MARGWESKQVEEQMAEGLARPAVQAGDADETRHQSALERARKERQRQELELQREHVLSQRTSNPARRAALEAALADIEGRLQQLDA